MSSDAEEAKIRLRCLIADLSDKSEIHHQADEIILEFVPSGIAEAYRAIKAMPGITSKIHLAIDHLIERHVPDDVFWAYAQVNGIVGYFHVFEGSHSWVKPETSMD